MKKYPINIQLRVLIAFVILSIATSGTGCKKLISVDAPVTYLNAENVFENDGTAIAALTAIYATNVSSTAGEFGYTGLAFSTGLSSDELTLYSGATSTSAQKLRALYTNNFSVLQGANDESPVFWNFYYSVIFRCNSALEGLSKSKKLSVAVKQQLLGEAKFMRAYCYFYLVNLYGAVPMALTTDPEINNSLDRAPEAVVYQQIIADLRDAQQLLSPNFLNASLQPYTSSPERLRPTSWAATALLSRTLLYLKDYAGSEAEATKIIDQSNGLFGLASLNATFLKNSIETIWALQPVRTGRNTEDGIGFILSASGPTDITSSGGNPVYLSSSLLSSFENDDQRKMLGNWVNRVVLSGISYYYPSKYKAGVTTVSEYQVILRFSEQYLIRAEARANLNKLTGALADLNLIRNRAGLGAITTSGQANAIDAIAHERQVELFAESGHRWLDLKRTGKIDNVMSSVRPSKANGGAWETFMKFYPIPFSEIQYGRNLVQNPGYN